MGTKGRWRSWLAGLIFLLVALAIIWARNPVNIGTDRESQRAWLALGYCMIALFVFVPPLAFRVEHEAVAQRTLIIAITFFVLIAIWWVGFLPSDPLGCSRFDAPDCHTTAATRWRAISEGLAVFGLCFLSTHALGTLIARYRNKAASKS